MGAFPFQDQVARFALGRMVLLSLLLYQSIVLNPRRLQKVPRCLLTFHNPLLRLRHVLVRVGSRVARTRRKRKKRKLPNPRPLRQPNRLRRHQSRLLLLVVTSPDQPALFPNVPPSKSGSPHSPTRPKTIKTNAPANQSGAVRSGSSSSSSSSHPPQTPKTPNARSAATSKSNTGAQASPSRLSPYTTRNESPLARHSRKPLSSKTFTPSTPSSSSHGNMSHISEANSEDSDEADVEMLLAPMANMCAPTPAMPRVLQKSRKRLAPETPTRTSATVGPSMSNLPGRANLSYLSPLPPDKDGSSSLRPNHPSNAPAMRGSILSWEQLANEASKTLGADEIENMLYDIPAPFRSGAVSPSPSMMHLEIPESPCLSALSSPGGYGSISQVLLPDVTPSPAMHHIMHRQYDSASAEAPAVDHAIVTLLRLQLASAENTGKERLQQMQKLEEEVHLIKGARARETQELMKQVEVMESQLRGSLEMRERADEEKRVYMTSLEEQVRLGQTRQDRAVEDAKRSLKEEMRQEWRSEMRKREKKIELRSCAKEVKGTWEKVKYQSESQLDSVRADLAVLKVFLQELDVLQSQVAVM
ncbi:hypothetical protein BDN72DRAFT_8439 [Pluteus cervinus]|uniref:Uncharacterized protein n=1 Tax=Pluteus cervinus TaxID=181527 RepID=A0ACD3BGS0_9AGAR|nr:hypothetical protein BDN72DRAFT_8439 [Pluteus cervinus]